MAKKTDKAEQVQMGKAVNCSDKCINYEVCEVEGNFSRFMPGAECTDISLENKDDIGNDASENLQDDPKAGENTGQDAANTEKETATGTKKRYVFPRQGDIKCPECGLCETIATSTQGKIQYRRCTRAIPVCSHPLFKVIGEEIVLTDCKQGTG